MRSYNPVPALPIASFMKRKRNIQRMRNLFKEKYMGNIIMYEEMLGYVHRSIFIVTFLYYTLLSPLTSLYLWPRKESSNKYLEL